MNNKHLFITFLKQHDAYSNYVNIMKHKHQFPYTYKTLNEQLYHMFNDTASFHINEWIESVVAFTDWSKTKQGILYWFMLHVLWNITLYNNKCIDEIRLKLIIRNFKTNLNPKYHYLSKEDKKIGWEMLKKIQDNMKIDITAL